LSIWHLIPGWHLHALTMIGNFGPFSTFINQLCVIFKRPWYDGFLLFLHIRKLNLVRFIYQNLNLIKNLEIALLDLWTGHGAISMGHFSHKIPQICSSQFMAHLKNPDTSKIQFYSIRLSYLLFSFVLNDKNKHQNHTVMTRRSVKRVYA